MPSTAVTSTSSGRRPGSSTEKVSSPAVSRMSTAGIQSPCPVWPWPRDSSNRRSICRRSANAGAVRVVVYTICTSPSMDLDEEADWVRPLVRIKRSGLALSRDLMEGRVQNFVAVHLWRALNDLRQTLEYLGIGVAAVLIRALLAIPQADGERILAARPDERDLILEAILLPQHGQDVLLERLGELGGGVGLEIDGHIPCVHS